MADDALKLVRQAERRLRAQLGKRRVAPRPRTDPDPLQEEARPVPMAISNGDGIARVEAWFAARGMEPFAFQREVWRRYFAGESGLVHAATGTGKTLAAWIGPLVDWMDSDAHRAPPLTVLWVTPMRALAHDTRASLEQVVAGLRLPWTVALRTGDTPPAERAKQDRRLPSALVTTPESLTLLLTRANHRELFARLRLVVVDEWHELMGNKRGVQVELALARLKRVAPTLRIWGLSATLGNLDDALDRLLAGGPGAVIAGEVPKAVAIDALLPADIEHFPWAGYLGTKMVAEVATEIERSATTLVFTNTRSQAELWYQALLAHRPEWAGVIALHHGSLDLDLRRWVEQGLKTGVLRAVICTSSLDLGVDFSPVDRIIQVGSPKGVARLLQRAGRSGHRPGAVSRVTCVPTHALELVEAAAARTAAQARRIESRRPVTAPLDVLIQHVVTVALGGGFEPDALLDEVRETRAYREMTDEQWRWVLSFVTRGGVLAAYPEYRRVTVDARNIHRVEDAAIARRHRASLGTIVSDASINVQFVNGARLGTVEEGFISRLNAGDCFVIGGRIVELVRLKEMTAWVRRASPSRGIVPRWMGGRMPLSNELSQSVRATLEAARSGRFDSPELQAVRPLLEIQARASCIPRSNELLIERHETREGHHLFFFPFAGRHVHTGLSALFAWRLAQRAPASFSMAVNDYGFELLSPTPVDIEAALADGLLSPERLREQLRASLNAAELAKRQFREIARVAGLVFQGYPGDPKTAKQLQASSGLLFDVFTRHDPENLLLRQAEQEVLERQLEYSRLEQTMHEIGDRKIVVVAPARMTPFALPLLVEHLREKLSTEKLADRVERMQVAMRKGS